MQPTYKRQRFLLSFIRQINTGVTKTDLQKLIFLYTMRHKLDHYSFIPYMYGSYSFQLSQDIETLAKDGYLAIDKHKISSLGMFLDSSQFQIDAERGDNLIRKAYNLHPFYAINSEIVDRILTENERTKVERIKNNLINDNQVLFTVGYEGNSVESFCNILLRKNVYMLCDVRKNPISRKFGFSKNKLAHILESIGIKYTHIPQLGIESENRTSLNSLHDYQKLFAEYAKKLPSQSLYLKKVYDLLQANTRIALMCYESDRKTCHRTEIKKYLVENYSITGQDL